MRRPNPSTLFALVLLLGMTLAGCFGGDTPPPDEDDDVERVRGPITSDGGDQAQPILNRSDQSIKTFAQVESFDGHMVPITVYQPVYASADDPVPVLLHSHGWAGSRTTDDGAFGPYVSGGFGVVSIDMRGHGDARATSQARVHNVDYEIQDVIAVIDHVATLDWALLDGDGDPRLGALGGSYGGGYQLLAAVYDDRLDAIAPEITWNSLPSSLAPNMAIKSAWIDVLYFGGRANANLHESIDQGFAWAQATNTFPDGSEPGEPDFLTPFTRSSPAAYPGAIDIPTLLIQGANDTLFNVNEAVANYRLIEATGAPVRLVTHFDGHILNTNGTLDQTGAPGDQGLQPPRGPHPCGDVDEMAVAWYQKHLLHLDVVTGASTCFAIDGTTVASANQLPWLLTSHGVDDLSIVLGAPDQEDTATVLEPTQDTYLVGVPYLQGNLTATSADTIVYATLQVTPADGGDPYVLNAQVTPLRHPEAGTGTSQTFLVELGAIAGHLAPGDTLSLTVSSSDPQYAHNQARSPGTAELTGLTLHLPRAA